MLTPFVIEQFGGLNITDDPFEVGATGAVALSNVTFDNAGSVRTRAGYETLATTSTLPLRVHSNPAQGTLFTSSLTKLEAFDQAGTGVGTVTPGFGPYSFVNYGTATTSYTIASNSFDSNLRLWNGSAWSAGSTTTGTHLGVMEADNRLVVAGQVSHRIRFSDPGDPNTFGANNYVDFAPGDGEIITGVASYLGSTFVFKESKIMVFYGNSVDGDGEPVFNNRVMEHRGALQGTGTVCGTSLGVFFLSREGVFRTDGGPPVLISRGLDPLFRFGPSAMRFNSNCSLSYHQGTLYLVLDNAGVLSTYVFDTVINRWSQWSTHTGKASGNFAGDEFRAFAGSLYFVNGTNSKIYRMTPDATFDDDGTPIAWSWKSGKYALSDPGRVTCTLETSLDGSGTVALRLDSDLYTNQNGTATLGTAPAVAEGFVSGVDQEGRWIQHTLSGTGPAIVKRLTHYVNFTKPTGVR